MGTNKVKLLLKGLFRGLKSADDVISTQASYGSSDGTITQQMSVDSIYNDLLLGKETQRVKETRDEYYRTIHEANNYHVDVIGLDKESDEKQDNDKPFKTMVRKKTALDFSCKIDVLNKENLPLVCIQDNIDVQTQNNFTFDLKNDTHESIFKIKRENGIIPRFKIEHECTKIVIRKFDENTSYIDFYIPKYPSQFGFVVDAHGRVKRDNKNFLLSELCDLFDGKIWKSDIFDINGVEFDTEKAYGVPNPSHFEFDNLQYKYISKFDGSFVITMSANNKEYYTSIEKYHTDELDEKLEKHAVRDGVSVDLETIIRNSKDKDENSN